MGKTRKFVAILIAVLMLLPLTACATTAATAAPTAAPATADATATAAPASAEATATAPSVNGDIMTPAGRYPDTITISTGKEFYANPNFPEGKSSHDNAMLDFIKEKLNIQFNILWEVDASEYNNKLSLSIAAGDIPDMIRFRGDDYLTFRQMVNDGALADLTDAYNKCAGDYMKQTINSFVGNRFDPLTFDGKIYAYPNATLGYSHDILWIRNDWLRTVGMQPPKTIDDIKAVIKAFMDKDPGKNGTGKTVGMVLNATVPVGGYGNSLGSEPIFNSFGAFPKQWMKGDDGKVYYGSIAPEMKQGLQVLADMYKAGLIDKSFLTRTGPGETDAVINDNLCGVYFNPWWNAWPRADLAKAHPESDWIAVNAPLNADGKFVHEAAAPTDGIIAMSAKCKYPEALIKTLNIEFESYRGLNADGAAVMKPYIDNNVLWQAMYPTSDINLEFYDAVPKLGKLVKDYIDTGSLNVLPTTSAYDKTTAENAKRYFASKDVKDTGWIDYYARYVGSNGLNTPENVEKAACFYYSTASMTTLKPALDTMENTMYLQIITGEKPVSYFDDFVTQWKAAGGDKLTDEVQNLVK